MSGLGPTPRRRVVRALERLGFTLMREGGRHSIYGRDDPPPKVRVPIPRHAMIKGRTLESVIRAVGVSEEEFLRHL